MSAPFQDNTLEDQLARLKVLLRTVETELDHVDVANPASMDHYEGAEVCLGYALDVLDRLEHGLPAATLRAKIPDGAR